MGAATLHGAAGEAEKGGTAVTAELFSTAGRRSEALAKGNIGEHFGFALEISLAWQ